MAARRENRDGKGARDKVARDKVANLGAASWLSRRSVRLGFRPALGLGAVVLSAVVGMGWLRVFATTDHLAVIALKAPRRACAEIYAGMPALCRPRVCGHIVVDSFASDEEVVELRAIASAGMSHGGGSGGPTVLDLHSGALSFGSQFISVWHKLNATGAPAIATAAQLDMLERVYARIRETAGRAFQVDHAELSLASPTFWSKIEGAQQPQTRHDEYWHPHVDTEQYGSFAYTALLYLSTHGSDFKGGDFEFVDQVEGSRILPARGRLLLFTSGPENRHRVTRVESGERLTLTVPFTCDPAAGVGLDWLSEARASLRRNLATLPAEAQPEVAAD
jgi:hypothetical protein